MLLSLASLAVVSALTSASPAGEDPRDAYDVKTYRLDLRVEPGRKLLAGHSALEAEVLVDGFDRLVLDMHADLVAEHVLLLPPGLDGTSSLEGQPLRFEHAGDRLVCELPRAFDAGSSVTVAVRYHGSPGPRNDFDGVHWRESGGRPWIGTSVQSLGAHYWWPCKSSFYNPEDRHERLFVNATVPAGLTAVSNGRLARRVGLDGDWVRFEWEHPYPCDTYAIALNVGPYVTIEGELRLGGVDRPVPYAWYVLPDSEPKARKQFAQVPEIVECFTNAFGPWPFPESKLGLVETSFWGMEHSTAVAYGSSFPAWAAANGKRDRFARRNRWFDYILVHELAHEWWGNAVAAADWGDFWIHEGFATYAGGLFVEHTRGRAAADAFFAEQVGYVHAKEPLYRGRGTDSKQAFAGVIYSKGGCVLNTMRHYLDDDELWWRILREFQRRFRYGVASTGDFRAVVEELSGSDWAEFFEEWVYGSGFPRLTGRVVQSARALRIEVDNPVDRTGFHVPLDLAWSEGTERKRCRLWLEPGRNRLEVECGAPPERLVVLHLDRLLGRHSIEIEASGR